MRTDPKSKPDDSFMGTWYSPRVRAELYFLQDAIQEYEMDLPGLEYNNAILQVVLSRTARSCRATPHHDLTTLKKPVFEPYYCFKHKKTCYPIESIEKFWHKYAWTLYGA